MQLFLPILPVSANAYYRFYNGHMYITEKGKKQKQYIHNYIFENNISKIEGPVHLKIDVTFKDNRPHDLDNILKPLLDCLKDKCFGDDDLIYRLEVYKWHGTCNEVKIWVGGLDKI